MSKTKMYVISEISDFMMGYVIITDEGNCIIVDGGYPADIPHLREVVKGHPVKAWILTHPHADHITAFNHLMREGDPDFAFEAVYCHFPCVEYMEKKEPGQVHTLKEFEAVRPLFEDRLHIVNRGDVITVDNVRMEILYHWEESYGFDRKDCIINNTSIAFRLDTQDSSVMFLGDLGPEGGDKLMEFGADKLKADYCQMAHHGHSGVGPEVYIMINPRVCMWNARDWLYEEPAERFGHRIWGSKMTRLWMERLGVTEHIVTKDGTAEVCL